MKIENGVLKSVQPKDLRGGVFRINAVHKLLDRIHSLTGIGKSGQITSIDGMAFAECEKVLTSVEVPEGVTSIGWRAFSGCSNLTSINIPDSVTSIGNNAFSGCSNLTSINIPESVTSIGNNAFSGCNSFPYIEIPENELNMDNPRLDVYKRLPKIKIIEGVTRIKEDTFKGWRDLTSINIPEGVTSIGAGAFSGCSSLTSITIPEGVTSIEYGAFSGCSNLTSINIPESVTSIGDNAFSGCSNLTSINIPDSVTSIGHDAFSECSSLTSVTIPAGVTSVRWNAFSRCRSLTSVTIPESVTSIESSAFSECRSLTSVTIPEGVTRIGDNAFSKCDSLTSVTIPEGVTSIGAGAFSECSSLASVDIPKSVPGINAGVFSGCSSLTSINIPEGVTQIGDNAFVGCSSLTGITIPEGVTSIGNNAFVGCSSLISITIPDSVKSIGRRMEFLRSNARYRTGVFDGCESLRDIIISDRYEKNEDALLWLYRDFGKKSSRIREVMFGNDLDRFEKIKAQASFSKSADYDETFMDELYHKIIYSVGLDELERMVKIPNIDGEQLQIYRNVFREKQRIKGEFGDITSVLRQLSNAIKSVDHDVIEAKDNVIFAEIRRLAQDPNYAEASEEDLYNVATANNGYAPDFYKESSRDGILIEFDKLLENENSEISTLKDLINTAITNAGYDSSKIGESIEKIQETLNRSQFERNMDNVSSRIIEALSSSDSQFGEQLNTEAIESIKSVIEDKLREIYMANSMISVDGLRDILLAKLSEDGHALYIRQNAENIANRFMNLLDTDEDFKEQINFNTIDALKKVRAEIGEKWIDKIEDAYKNISRKKNFKDVPDEFFEEEVDILGEKLKIKIETEIVPNQYKEKYGDLYEEKQRLNDEFGVVTSILKQIAQSINSSSKDKKLELSILSQMNKLLEIDNSGIVTLKELLTRAMASAGYDSSKIEENIDELQRALNKRQFVKNMDKVYDKIIEALSSSDSQFGAQLVTEQIRPIEVIIEDKLREIYMANGMVSIEGLREELLVELSDHSHAPYIRLNAVNIANRFMNLLNTDEKFREQINFNTIDALKKVKAEIGGKWIGKIQKAYKEACGQRMESIPDELSEDQLVKLKESLKINIETEKIAVPKSGADREEIYRMLEAVQKKLFGERYLIVTYKQLHDMFGGVHYPYSEKFREFFKLHRDEFMSDSTYKNEFASICNNFEMIVNSPELKNIYLNGNLELKDILGFLGNITYKNQRPGDEKIARLASAVGKIATEKEFSEVQEVFDIVKERERTSIPPIYIPKKEKYRGRMLSPNDILVMFAGNITDCCQRFGDAGMGSMMLGAVEENAGIFVVEELQEDGSYQIVGQSLTIRQKSKNGNYDRLTFDNIEISDNVKKRLTESDEKEILGIYKDAGEQAINFDKKFLGKLLQEGKITQEDFDNLVLKEVIAGRGYNDLNVLNELEGAETVVPDEAYYKYKTKIKSDIRPWIDSTEKGAPWGSNSYVPVSIAKMSEEDLEIINQRRAKSNKKVSDITNIPLWYGKVDEINECSNDKITEQQIQILKRIEAKVYRKEQQLINSRNAMSSGDLKSIYELSEVTAVVGSEENWYMVYGTGSDGTCKIQDLAMEGGLNSTKNTESTEKQNASIIATAEMADYVYALMIKKAKEGTKIVCNATKDTSLINIKNMVKKGLIEIRNMNGKKIVLSESGDYTYEDGNEVQYRDFSNGKGSEKIQMLDIEIIPNLDKMIEEKAKIDDLLQKARKVRRMKATEKEKDIDERRESIRSGGR